MDEIMNRIGEVYEPFKVHFLLGSIPITGSKVLENLRW